MAYFKLMLKLQDDYNGFTKRSFTLSAADYATADAAATAFVDDYQAVTELHIYQWSLTEDHYVTGDPETGANKDEGMTIIANLTTPGKTAPLHIPGPVHELRAADRSILIGDALMVALLANYTSSGPVLISDKEIVNSWKEGKLDS
jgi:hypothetical protein